MWLANMAMAQAVLNHAHDYYDAGSWYVAVVPGTVLTTLIARGVYPDPTYGLNNLAIPESLSRQDYWYRTTFDAPPNRDGKRFTLTFKGINYYAEVWLNGTRLGVPIVYRLLQVTELCRCFH